jgi:SAM-dependent methyltransferase
MTSAASLGNIMPRPGAASIRGLLLRCPQCGGMVEQAAEPDSTVDGQLRCPDCAFVLREEHGIWKSLPPSRAAYFDRFMQEYQIVRAAEGRGSEKPEYYLALPHRDLSRCNQSQWAIRSTSFRYIERKILPTIEPTYPGGMKVLDLGAGNGWMSYRLALRGHQPVAVDLLTNDQDGLGAAINFTRRLPVLFERVQAELSRLPFADNQFDVAIFNASFHYSENYEETLGEAIRCLAHGGTVIIADTAWYRRAESGQQMLAERRGAFTKRYGFPSDAIQSLEYLTDERLSSLEKRFGFLWQVHSPFYGVGWATRPLLAKLRGKREPSRFRIYVAEARK